MTARAKWLASQERWHAGRLAWEESALIYTPGNLDAQEWHRSQVRHYSRQLAALCLNGGKGK